MPRQDRCLNISKSMTSLHMWPYHGLDTFSDLESWQSAEDYEACQSPSENDFGDRRDGPPIIPSPPEPIVTQKKQKSRAPWGTGRDAQSQEEYRHYNLQTSKVMCCLGRQYGHASKRMLRNLMDRVVQTSEDGMRISPPCRAEKRSKRGLAQWLDRHWDFVMIVLNGRRELH
jgi:hypothetical protein